MRPTKSDHNPSTIAGNHRFDLDNHSIFIPAKRDQEIYDMRPCQLLQIKHAS